MIEIYTDGACNQATKNGGWSFIILEDKQQKVRKSGSVSGVTNNQCEMLAAIHSMQELDFLLVDNQTEIKLYSDSAYLVNAFVKDWISNWRLNGWQNYEKKPVLNKEYWEQLIFLQEKHRVEFIQIPRRSNNFAKKVDELAKKNVSGKI